MKIDDPKLTSFALDELEEPERSKMAEAVSASPEAQETVNETRALAVELKHAFATDLAHETELSRQTQLRGAAMTSRSINLNDIQGDRWFWGIGRPLAIAAVLAVCAVIAALTLLPFPRAQVRMASGPRLNLPPPRQNEVQAEVQPEFAEGNQASPTDTYRRDDMSEFQESAKTNAAATSPPYEGVEAGLRTDKLDDRLAQGPSLGKRARFAAQPASPVPGLRTLDRSEEFGAGDAHADQFNTAAYDHIEENPFLDAKTNPLSTFSIDVDTASYAIVRQFLNQGALPPKDAVRVEEMLNYFSYDYAEPTEEKPFAVHVDMAGCPWEPSHRLVRIGLKGKEIATNKRGPSNLVFLLDVSGSMTPAERLPLIKQSMRLLVDKLTENDRVAIVVYAGNSGLVLPSTRGDKKEKIMEALEHLEAGGSTNGAEGIELAYKVAQANFIKGGVNRVILATDGDFNIGVTNQGDLIRLIQNKAKSGVFLSVLGVGTDNLKDSTMQKLADKGNGNYAYLDSIDEARKVLVEQMNGTLVTIAKDVKIQVEFNPARVASYRLIGYEKRMLRKEDFNNDKVDAGEIGAGHTVTALYEVVPVDATPNPATTVPAVDSLKYQSSAPSARSSPSESEGASQEMLTVKLRYKRPDGDKSDLIEQPVVDSNAAFASASADLKFAAAVAEFGMLLRESEHKGNGTFGSVLEWAQEGKGADTNGYRAGFIDMVRKAQRLSKG